ncbi:RNA polymerase sigma factor [Croceicoccus bisphenolivorans]|uniref:RNA polymerase sigma factor n=1 Tax=Croceicoccus bisphenolivorans TaxID=1783232 RepID=UPI00082C4381|nr:RNA polymerase sigma factor [Croceicoccus bisphenolivorans]
MEVLYREHATALTRYIARRFGSGPPEPEEVCQTAFARLAAIDGTASVQDARRYLYTIACNVVIDHQRSQIRREEAQHDLAQSGHYQTASPCPEQVLYERQRFSIFERTLRSMPGTRRRIFLLVRVEGLSPRQVAAQFGMSEGAVYKHVQRALEDCAKAFAKAEHKG